MSENNSWAQRKICPNVLPFLYSILLTLFAATQLFFWTFPCEAWVKRTKEGRTKEENQGEYLCQADARGHGSSSELNCWSPSRVKMTQNDLRSRYLIRWYQWCCYCSVPKSCLTLYNPMDCGAPDLPVPHHLSEFAQVHVHWIGDAIQSSHPFFSCLQSFPAAVFCCCCCCCCCFPISRLFASDDKVLELEIQHQSFQWVFRVDFL